MGDQLSRKEVARILGVSSLWLAKGAMGLNAARELPFVKYGQRVVRYALEDVEAFRQRHKVNKEPS